MLLPPPRSTLFPYTTLSDLANINEYISAVQIGITMTSIGIGALGEPALAALLKGALGGALGHGAAVAITARSEEHTSELQSHSDLVCRLLLEKKKKKNW